MLFTRNVLFATLLLAFTSCEKKAPQLTNKVEQKALSTIERTIAIESIPEQIQHDLYEGLATTADHYTGELLKNTNKSAQDTSKLSTMGKLLGLNNYMQAIGQDSVIIVKKGAEFFIKPTQTAFNAIGEFFKYNAGDLPTLELTRPDSSTKSIFIDLSREELNKGKQYYYQFSKEGFPLPNYNETL